MKTMIAKPGLELGALGAFFFVFLGFEYYYDIALSSIVPASQVVLGQGAALGASVLGFGAFCLLQAMGTGLRRAAFVIVALLLAGSMGSLDYLEDPTAYQSAGCLGFIALGVFGGAAHWRVSLKAASAQSLGFGLGCAYAVAIAAQSALITLVPTLQGALFWLLAGTVFLLAGVEIFDRRGEGTADCTGEADCEGGGSGAACVFAPRALSRRDLIWSVVIMALLSLMFTTLDNMVTLADAKGEISVAGWPRLLLAVSAVAAGWLFDYRDRKYMDSIMFCTLLVSTITILAFEATDHRLFGLGFFYLTSGFFVTYFTTRFVILAPRTPLPQLWASMGRIVNNLCAFAFSWLSLVLIEGDVFVGLMVASIGLLVLVCVAFIASGTFGAAAPLCADTALETMESLEQRHLRFAERYGLTVRESEVLMAVASGEAPLKSIAADLGISLRMLQKHLTSIYQKTGTQTRSGLTRKYAEEASLPK